MAASISAKPTTTTNARKCCKRRVIARCGSGTMKSWGIPMRSWMRSGMRCTMRRCSRRHGLTTRGRAIVPRLGPSPRRRGEGATRRCTRLAAVRILRHPPARAIERANPRVLRRTRRARGRNAGALARRQQRAQHRLVLARILRSHRRARRARAGCAPRPNTRSSACSRPGSAIATNSGACSATAKAGGRQSRIHHARVVPRRLGSSSIDWRNRGTGAHRWRWSDAPPPCRDDLPRPVPRYARHRSVRRERRRIARRAGRCRHRSRRTRPRRLAGPADDAPLAARVRAGRTAGGDRLAGVAATRWRGCSEPAPAKAGATGIRWRNASSSTSGRWNWRTATTSSPMPASSARFVRDLERRRERAHRNRRWTKPSSPRSTPVCRIARASRSAWTAC